MPKNYEKNIFSMTNLQNGPHTHKRTDFYKLAIINTPSTREMIQRKKKLVLGYLKKFFKDFQFEIRT